MSTFAVSRGACGLDEKGGKADIHATGPGYLVEGRLYAHGLTTRNVKCVKYCMSIELMSKYYLVFLIRKEDAALITI